MSYRLKTLIHRAGLVRRRLDVERARQTPNLLRLIKLQRLHLAIKRRIADFDPPSPNRPAVMAISA